MGDIKNLRYVEEFAWMRRILRRIFFYEANFEDFLRTAKNQTRFSKSKILPFFESEFIFHDG